MAFFVACSPAAPAPQLGTAQPGASSSDPAAPAAPAAPRVDIGTTAAEQKALLERMKQTCAPIGPEQGEADDSYLSRCYAKGRACADAQLSLQALVSEAELEVRQEALAEAAQLWGYASCSLGRDRCSTSVSNPPPADTSLCAELDWIIDATIAATESPEPKMRAAGAYALGHATGKPRDAVVAVRNLVRRALANRQSELDVEIAHYALIALIMYDQEPVAVLPELRAIIETRLLLRGKLFIVARALSAIGQLRERGLAELPLFINALDDSDEELRLAAAQSLMGFAYLGHDISAAVPALERHKNDRNTLIRENVNNSLKFNARR